MLWDAGSLGCANTGSLGQVAEPLPIFRSELRLSVRGFSSWVPLDATVCQKAESALAVRLFKERWR